MKKIILLSALFAIAVFNVYRALDVESNMSNLKLDDIEAVAQQGVETIVVKDAYGNEITLYPGLEKVTYQCYTPSASSPATGVSCNQIYRTAPTMDQCVEIRCN